MHSNILLAAEHARYTKHLSNIHQFNSHMHGNDSDIIKTVEKVVTSMTEQTPQLNNVLVDQSNDTDMKCRIIHVSFITLTTAEVMLYYHTCIL